MTSRTYAHATGEHREAALAALGDFVARAGGVDGGEARRRERAA